jgi:histidyl-tRNA synthetase
MGGRTLEDIAQRFLRKRKQASERGQMEAALEWLHHWVQINAHPEEAFAEMEKLIGSDQAARQTLNEWRTTVDLVIAYDIHTDHIWLQPALARSWEYYTGIVFELRTSGDVHLGGGGRYDELARLIGGKDDVPAVGFAYYVDSLLTSLPSGQAANNHSAIFVHASDAKLLTAVEWACQLRQRARTVILASETQADASTIFIGQDGNAHFGNNDYPLSQIDSLLNDLDKTQHGYS